jgi:hypothetical protein
LSKNLKMKRVTTFVKWKIVNGFPEYKISNNGLLLKNGVLQSPLVENLGKEKNLFYKYVNLKNKSNKNRFGKKFFIHRLVWIHFGNNENYKPLVIDHINNDSMDNRIENLRLISIYENLIKGKISKLLKNSS